MMKSVYVCVCVSDTPPSPASVHKLHGFYSKCCGHDVISIMSSPTDHHQAIHLTSDEHQTPRTHEAQQASPSEGVLTDQSACAAHRKNLNTKHR